MATPPRILAREVEDMNKIKVTAQQRKNAREAQRMWATVPTKNVIPSLRAWREDVAGSRPPTCGTTACFGGWCAWWPAFRQLGITAGYGGQPRLLGADGFHVAAMLFGWEGLFEPRMCLPIDKDFVGDDHALIAHRLEWLITHSEVGA